MSPKSLCVCMYIYIRISVAFNSWHPDCAIVTCAPCALISSQNQNGASQKTCKHGVIACVVKAPTRQPAPAKALQGCGFRRSQVQTLTYSFIICQRLPGLHPAMSLTLAKRPDNTVRATTLPPSSYHSHSLDANRAKLQAKQHVQ